MNNFEIDKNGGILCPRCGSKTRTKIRKDTVIINFPCFCPKCKNEFIVNYNENINIEIDIEPDAETQSQNY